MPKRVEAYVVILLVSLCGTLFGLSKYGVTFERNIGLPWLFKIRGPVDPPSNVVVVGINNRTSKKLGLPRMPLDWPRSIHAELLDTLVNGGAKVVAFDMHFFQPKESEHDNAFVNAVRKSNRVVLFEKLERDRHSVTDQTGKNIGSAWIEQTVPPMESLASAARGMGPFPLPKIDAELHQFWVFKPGATDKPTLPSVALQLYLLDIYDDLRRTLDTADRKSFEKLPGSSKEIVNAEQLRSTMVELRRILTQNPELKKKIFNLIKKDATAGDIPNTRMSHINALLNMYSGREHRYLNLYGPPGSVKNLPYSAVIEGGNSELSNSDLDFTDAVVFVGYADMLDPGQPDRFYTVYSRDDGVDLSGVEIMATSFGNLLTDRALKPLGATENALIMLVVGILVGVSAYLLPAAIGIALGVFIAVLYMVFAHFVFSAYALWLPTATPLLIQFPGAIFVGLCGQYFIERRKAKQMREVIGHYLPEDAVRILTGADPDQEKINKVVYSACLATDLADFTSMAEKIGPAELAELLNDFFESLATTLKNNAVDVTEFRADAMMCAWTAESPQRDVRQHSLQASLKAIDVFNQFTARNPKYSGNLRIGLDAGMVYIGHSGGGGKYVYSIVGDSANTASRVEGLNKHIGTRVLATETIVQDIDGFLLRNVGRFQFLGKTEQLQVFEVIAERQDASPNQEYLCEQFSEALAVFQKADWKGAQKQFESILTSSPHDGPSLFYRQQCQCYIDGDPVPDDAATIQMTRK